MISPRLTALLPLFATACATVPATDTQIHAIDRSSADHYVWGGVNDGWHLAKQPGLSVIEEQIAPGTGEIRHYHRRARQFFYVLSGELTMEVDGQIIVLATRQGVEIPPGTPHKAQNRSAAPVEILVTSTPPSHGDRVEALLPAATAMPNP
ncbi:cupin domain-containing protein [Sphingobium aromaticiconvertens]|uniref:cupin domain-containing protein n=1 Tax=Sphingobium aromaticiconvertens TaxID=365341 RepID=UPI003018E44B